MASWLLKINAITTHTLETCAFLSGFLANLWWSLILSVTSDAAANRIHCVAGTHEK